jgi:hypothetical protein
MSPTTLEIDPLDKPIKGAARSNCRYGSTNLTFNHPRVAMAAAPEERQEWPLRASRAGWSVAELRRKLGQASIRCPLVGGEAGSCCGFEQLRELVRRGIRFGNIYADPPWLYDNQGTPGATINLGRYPYAKPSA